MSRSLNKVMLIGNVGAEPEIRSTPGGTKLAKVSLATNRTFSDRSGQQQEKTEWHRLTFWDKLADLVERFIKKGDRLYIEGRIEYSETEDQQGNKRYWTDIVVREMVMLGGGGEGGGGGGSYSGGRARSSGAAGGGAAGGGGTWGAGGSGGGSGGGGGGGGPFQPEDDDLPF